MKHSNIEELITKSLLGKLRSNEQQQLNNWLNKSQDNKNLYNKILQENSLTESYNLYRSINSKKAWKLFKQNIARKENRLRLFKYAAIVIIPFTLILTALLYNYNKTIELQDDEIIYPGCSMATLMSDNGETVLLQSDTTRQIITEKDLIAVQSNGELSYLQQNEKIIDKDTVSLNNTLLTQSGNEYRITLADGTKVHLNYNTKLKYPAAFGKKERLVYLEGEAFFDVAPDKERPFYVVTHGMKIKQYGTSFNVNNFSPDETSVVLVKGSIALIPDNNSSELMLKPGQRAILNLPQKNVCVDNVNVVTYTSWNNGYFNFEDESLEKIMRSISQWYNVEVKFETDKLKELRFTGILDRYSTINPILRAISRTVDVKIKITKGVITISH